MYLDRNEHSLQKDKPYLLFSVKRHLQTLTTKEDRKSILKKTKDTIKMCTYSVQSISAQTYVLIVLIIIIHNKSLFQQHSLLPSWTTAPLLFCPTTIYKWSELWQTSVVCSLTALISYLVFELLDLGLSHRVFDLELWGEEEEEESGNRREWRGRSDNQMDGCAGSLLSIQCDGQRRPTLSCSWQRPSSSSDTHSQRRGKRSPEIHQYITSFKIF